MEQINQVQQLKINVNNINSVLKASNKEYDKLKKQNSVLLYRKLQREKKELKEKKIESKNKFRFGLGTAKDIVTSQIGNIFDKILGFASFILGGILVNALPGIIKKTKEIFDSIVDFVTPIQSGFNLIKGFFEGDLDKSKYDADKKRVDDKLVELNKDGGLIDQIAEQTGILEPLIKLLKPAIEQVRNVVGGKNKVLAVKDGKEGVKDLDTGEFTERQFTAGERKKYVAAGGKGAGGAPSSGEEGSSGSIGFVSSLGSGNLKLNSLTDQDYSDLAYAVSGEAQRGTNDEYGVAANILTRVADPNYPNTIMGVFTAPGQYAAYSDGGAHRDPQLASKLKANKDKIADAIQILNGRTDFKGVAMYGNMGPGDIKFSNRGNFYHYASQRGRNDPAPKNPPQYWKKLVNSKSNPPKITPKTRDKNNQASVLNTTMGEEGTTTIMVLRQPVIVG